MKMYEFNKELLERLDEVTGISRSRIGQMAGKSKDFMRHIVLGSQDIKIGCLIELCDALQFPIGYFFYNQEEGPVENPARTFDYKPVQIDLRVVSELLKGEAGEYHVPIYKVMSAVGYEDCRSRSWTKDFSSMTARGLVALCNGMRLNMNKIIVDPMKKVPSIYTPKQFTDRCIELRNERIDYHAKYRDKPVKRRGRKKAATIEELSQTISEMKKLLEMQAQQIAELKRDNARLKRGEGYISLAAESNTYGE